MSAMLPIFLLFFFFLLGVPIGFALLIAVLPYFMFINTSLPVDVIIQRVVANTEAVSLWAIPFFIAAGTIMNYAGITPRLMKMAEALTGHMRGGLAQVNVLLSAMQGGLSGSCAADAAVQCKILVPEMSKRGYDVPFSAAVTAASSLITPIIPPGIGLILYAFLANVSVGKMFFAGYIPGILMTAGLMLLVHFISKRRGYLPSREKRAGVKDIVKIGLEAAWALFLPLGLILGLRIGMFTPTEGGAMCAVYSVLVGVFIYKDLKPTHIWPIIEESVLGTATVMLIMCTANAFSYYMSYERIPYAMSQFLIHMDLGKVGFLIAVNILFLVLGMFVEGGASMIILAPLLAPVAASLGIDLVHFGIIMVMNITIGAITPPFGVILFLVAPLLGIKVSTLTKEIWPFIGVLILVLIAVTFVPQIVLFIPNLVFG